MVPEQQDQIFYLVAPSRQSALSSAYLEALQAKKVEVLLLTSTIDEFAMANLHTYAGKELVAAEKAQLAVAAEASGAGEALSTEEMDGLRAWLVEAVPTISKV